MTTEYVYGETMRVYARMRRAVREGWPITLAPEDCKRVLRDFGQVNSEARELAHKFSQLLMEANDKTD